MNRVIDLLQTSTRPLILLGAGARESAPEIIAFCERWQIPMETTWNAVDIVPHAHPLFVGRPGIVASRGANMAIQSCDLLIAIGARLDPPTIAWDYSKFAPHAKKVLVDIDTGESCKIPNLDVFIHMDAGKFIKELAGAITELESSFEWACLCDEWKKSRLEGTTTTYHLLDTLSDQLPDDAIIVINNGCFAVNVFSAGFRNKAGQRFIMSSCGLGSMGGALPVAIGAALASGKTVYCIDGDGSIMQNIQELETVKRLRLPIVILVINNQGYASIRNSEMRAFGRTRTGETIPDIKAVTEGFGIHGVDYEDYFDVPMMSMWGLPIVINVDVPVDEVLIPRVMFDGRGSLEDMWPYG